MAAIKPRESYASIASRGLKKEEVVPARWYFGFQVIMESGRIGDFKTFREAYALWQESRKYPNKVRVIKFDGMYWRREEEEDYYETGKVKRFLWVLRKGNEAAYKCFRFGIISEREYGISTIAEALTDEEFGKKFDEYKEVGKKIGEYPF